LLNDVGDIANFGAEYIDNDNTTYTICFPKLS